MTFPHCGPVRFCCLQVAIALDATLDRTLRVDFSSNVFTDWIDRSFGGVYEFKVGEIEPTGDYIFMRADDYVRKLTDNGFILEGAVFEEMRYSVPPFQKIKFERLPKSSSLQFLYGSPELTELFPSGTIDTSYTPIIDHLLVNSAFSHFYPSIIDQVLTGSAVSYFAPDRRQLPFADLVPSGKYRVDGIVATDSSAPDIPTVYISDSLYAAICGQPNVFYDSLWLNIFSNPGYYDTLYDNYSIEDNSFKNALQSRNDLEVFQVIVLTLGIALVTAGCLFIFVVDYSEIKERHYEIALLKSFGTDDRRIIAGYIWLPLWLGLAVVVIAAGLGTLFAFGLDQSLLAFFRSDFLPSHILRLSWWHYLLLLATVLGPVIAAGSLIIRYLKNIDIEEIIRKGR